MKPLRILLSLFAGCLVAGCTSSPLDGNGDSVDTCASGQLSCFMNNLTIQDEDGNEIELVQIQGPLPNSITGSGTSPEITTTPTSVTVDDIDFLQSQNIGWTDPQGAQPVFCIRLCSNSVCTAVVTTPYGCAPSIPDGMVSGVWRTFLGYRAEPAGAVGTTEEFFFEVTPISMPNGQDLIQFFQDKQNAGEGISDLGPEQNVHTGTPVTIPHTVINSADEDGDDGDCPPGTSFNTSTGDCRNAEGCPADLPFLWSDGFCRASAEPNGGGTPTVGQCASNSDCSGFGSRNCAGSNNVLCASTDNLCHCCVTGGGGLSGCVQSCVSAADCIDPSTLCAQGVCVFSAGGAP